MPETRKKNLIAIPCHAEPIKRASRRIAIPCGMADPERPADFALGRRASQSLAPIGHANL